MAYTGTNSTLIWYNEATSTIYAKILIPQPYTFEQAYADWEASIKSDDPKPFAHFAKKIDSGVAVADDYVIKPSQLVFSDGERYESECCGVITDSASDYHTDALDALTSATATLEMYISSLSEETKQSLAQWFTQPMKTTPINRKPRITKDMQSYHTHMAKMALKRPDYQQLTVMAN